MVVRSSKESLPIHGVLGPGRSNPSLEKKKNLGEPVCTGIYIRQEYSPAAAIDSGPLMSLNSFASTKLGCAT